MFSRRFLFVWLVMLLASFVKGNANLHWGKFDEWSELETNKWGDLLVHHIEELFRIGEENRENELIKQELFASLMASMHACQNGIDEAAQKLITLFNEGSFYDTKVGSDVLEQDDPTFEINDEDDNDILIALEGLEGNFSESLANEDNVAARVTLVCDLKKIFRVLEHACSSLPSTIPDASTRKKRSPQKNVQSVAISLSKWTELWVDSLENKISNFLIDCLNNAHCKTYLESVIKKLVLRATKNKSDPLRHTSAILEDLILTFPYKNNPAMETLSYLQKAALNIEDSMWKEEDNAFHMAEKTSNNKAEDSLKKKEKVVENLLILSNLLRFESEKIATNNKGKFFSLFSFQQNFCFILF